MEVKYCLYMVYLSLPDDLASKANIIIDPAEIQATSMDDLDEDEESGAAQVCVCMHMCNCAFVSVCLYVFVLYWQ